MGTSEKCFLSIVCLILITTPQTESVLLLLSPLFWRQESPTGLPKLVTNSWTQVLLCSLPRDLGLEPPPLGTVTVLFKREEKETMVYRGPGHN